MPTFINAGTVTLNSGGTTTVTLNTPSPVTVGNLLIALIQIAGVTLSSTPSGWTYISDNMASGFFGCTVAIRVATGTETATYGWGISAVTNNVQGIIAQYSNAAIDVNPSYSGGHNSSSFSFNSLTPNVAGDTWIKYIGGSWNSGSPDTISSPGGTQQVGLTGGSFEFAYLWDSVIATTSPTGTASTTISPTGSGGTISLLLTTSGPGTVNGTATVSLGPVTLSSSGTAPTVFSTSCTLPLGPITLATLARLSFTATIPLGPVTLTSTSTAFAVTTIPLGPITTTVTSTHSAGGGTFVFIGTSP